VENEFIRLIRITKNLGLLVLGYKIIGFKIHIVVFGAITQCSLVGGYQRFRRTYCFHEDGQLKDREGG
jgi:hypothetical protein